jgi:hypothetical protein
MFWRITTIHPTNTATVNVTAILLSTMGSDMERGGALGILLTASLLEAILEGSPVLCDRRIAAG